MFPFWRDEQVDYLTIRTASQVIVTRNKDLDGLVNGTVGHVMAATYHCLQIQVKSGELFTLPLRSAWLTENGKDCLRTAFDIDLAYALTVHKVQGSTLDEGIIVFEVDSALSSNPTINHESSPTCH